MLMYDSPHAKAIHHAFPEHLPEESCFCPPDASSRCLLFRLIAASQLHLAHFLLYKQTHCAVGITDNH